MVTGISPVLLVSDLARSVAYHRDRLGFRCDVFGDPPDFATAKTRRGDDPARALRGAGTDRSQRADRRQNLERVHPRRRRREHLRRGPGAWRWLLTAVGDDRLGPLEGDADLAQDVAGERVGHAEHAEQDVLVGERPFAGVIERERERLLQPWRDPQAGGPRLLE